MPVRHVETKRVKEEVMITAKKFSLCALGSSRLIEFCCSQSGSPATNCAPFGQVHVNDRIMSQSARLCFQIAILTINTELSSQTTEPRWKMVISDLVGSNAIPALASRLEKQNIEPVWVVSEVEILRLC